MGLGSLRAHVFKIDDSSVVSDKSRCQGYQGVFHPEALLAWSLEHKQHPFLLRHVIAKHQPGSVLLRTERHLGLDLMNANRKSGPWQIRLGNRLGRAKARPCGKRDECEGICVEVLHFLIVDQEARPIAAIRCARRLQTDVILAI